MLGEIALYSFIILLLTGIFLTFCFKPSMAEVDYHGSYLPAQGLQMSDAYASTLNLSFDVRGGLLMRQIHHWAALLFVAAMVVHMLRIFFTGAFRKPRELNWLIGVTLLILGIIEGFAGYSLPDDLLSGTGLRIADGMIQAIPVIGTYLGSSSSAASSRATRSSPGSTRVHILLIPALILALITVHLILVVYHKHTQFAGPGRTEQQRRRLPADAGLHGQDRRLLLHRLRRHRAARRAAADQPGVDVRAVQPVAGDGGLAARLVHRASLEGSLRIMPDLESHFWGITTQLEPDHPGPC